MTRVGAGGQLPSITVEYRDVHIEADALVGTAAVPSLTKATWGFIKVYPLLYTLAVSSSACRVHFSRWEVQ